MYAFITPTALKVLFSPMVSDGWAGVGIKICPCCISETVGLGSVGVQCHGLTLILPLTLP